MTTIPEKKREIDIVAIVLAIFLGVAAFRAAQGPPGGQGAPVPAAVMAIMVLGILAIWLNWRRKPARILAISPEEIFFVTGSYLFQRGWTLCSRIGEPSHV